MEAALASPDSNSNSLGSNSPVLLLPSPPALVKLPPLFNNNIPDIQAFNSLSLKLPSYSLNSQAFLASRLPNSNLSRLARLLCHLSPSNTNSSFNSSCSSSNHNRSCHNLQASMPLLHSCLSPRAFPSRRINSSSRNRPLHLRLPP